MKEDFPVEDVVYVIHDEKSVRLFMADGSFFPESIAYYHVIKMLNDKFVRVNKNVIVNLEYAARIDGNCIILINDCKFNIDSEYEKNATNEFYKTKLLNFLPN